MFFLRSSGVRDSRRTTPASPALSVTLSKTCKSLPMPSRWRCTRGCVGCIRSPASFDGSTWEWERLWDFSWTLWRNGNSPTTHPIRRVIIATLSSPSRKTANQQAHSLVFPRPTWSFQLFSFWIFTPSSFAWMFSIIIISVSGSN